MESSLQPSPFSPSSLGFMDLPPEIRYQIYPLALELSCRSIGLTIFETWYYNLASTCRQIRFEALPLVLAQKNLGQMKFEQLLTWISTGTPQNLAMVRNLDLTLGRDCFEALEESPRLAEDLCKFVPEKGSLFINRYGEKFRPRPRKMVGNIVAWSETKSRNTIAALWNAFTAFPSIENLSINLGSPTIRKRSFLYNVSFVIHNRPEKELILEMLPSAFPKLLSFTIRASPLGLSYIQHFHHLRHLTCSGHFNSKPENTLATLRSLRNLVKITLEQSIGPSLTRSGLPLRSQRFCITPEIVSQLNPLKSFHIVSNMSIVFDAVKLTTPWISALLSHSSSLKDFRMVQMADNRQHEINISEILNFMCFSPIPDMSLQLLLRKEFATMDSNYLIAPQTGKVVDIFAYTPHTQNGRVLFKVNTGKYLPSTTEVEARKSLYEIKAGQTVLNEKFDDAAFMKL
jgi:hypothetical protein